MVLFDDSQYEKLEKMKSLAISTNIERCGAFMRITVDSFGNLNPTELKQAVTDAIDSYYSKAER